MCTFEKGGAAYNPITACDFFTLIGCLRLMGFWSSYKRLPRSQRLLIGISGIIIGWYGPSWMNYLFVDPGFLTIKKD